VKAVEQKRENRLILDNQKVKNLIHIFLRAEHISYIDKGSIMSRTYRRSMDIKYYSGWEYAGALIDLNP
jgi:hypothetical protein